MSDRARWALVVVLVALIVGLIAWDRGTDHHHGDEVGAERASYTSATTLRG
jgi:hypothetical protein